jgi:purine nucleosidase
MMNQMLSTWSDDWYRNRLLHPLQRVDGSGRLNAPIRIVIDTDAANEIDDQFALAWALRRPDRLNVEAIYATPFSFAHRKSVLTAAPIFAPPDAAPFCSPKIGMERSLVEIEHVLSLLALPTSPKVLAGSPMYLATKIDPVESDAAQHLVALARTIEEGDEPLYVVALGCLTNISSALLIAPDIAAKIVVIWTSGYPSHAPHINRAFNLEQDLLASQILFESKVPVLYQPGYHVGAQLRLSFVEMERYVNQRSAIGSYLHHLFTHNPLWPILGINGTEPYSWVIWDIICIAWLLEPNWVPSQMVPSPILNDALQWQPCPKPRPMREAYAVQRDVIFSNLFDDLILAPS